MYGEQLENVQHFKYLGAMLTDTGNSKRKEIRIRLATAVTVLVKLEKIWRSEEIDFKLKKRSFEMEKSVLFIIMYFPYDGNVTGLSN